MTDYAIFHWDRLRSIGEIRVVRLTILAPFIGYLILFNQEVVHWLTLSSKLLPADVFTYFWQDQPRTQEELASGRLFLIYFGLFFLGLGSIIYGVACPHLLKKYGSTSEYLRAELEFQTKFQAKRMLDELKELDNPPIHLPALIEKFQDHFNSILMDELPDGAKEFEQLSKDLMTEEWRVENTHHPITRRLTFAAYFLGFLILALPAVDTLLAVAKAFWR